MPTYETLNANGKSYIEFTPETGKAYKFAGLNQLADSHVYIIQSASTNSPGTHTVDPSEIRTVAQAITAGIVTKYDESAVTYFLEFANNYPVMVARITPVDALVDFESSSGLREDDLDVATGQALRVSQEAREVTERAGYRSVSATPETLGVFFGTDFVDSGDYWTFSGGYAGSIASDYLVFVDGELLAPSYLTAQTPDGTDGDFAVAKADYATPSEWHIVYIKDYISATLIPGPASVGTTELANLSVTTPKIALGAVDTDQLADASVTAAKLAPGAVTSTITTEGTKITGDGSVGDPVTLEDYSQFDITPAAFIARTPGSEDWEYYGRAATGIDYFEGVTLVVNSTASTSLHNYKLAEKDLLVTFGNGDTSGFNAELSVFISATGGTGITTTLPLFYNTRNATHVEQLVIPKGFYYSVRAINLYSSGSVFVYIMPIDHRPV
jgi:hypothetical protein